MISAYRRAGEFHLLPVSNRLFLSTVVLLLVVSTACTDKRKSAVDHPVQQSTWTRLQAAHAPFSIKAPHEEFGFFFTPELLGRRDPQNICTVSESGFRGAAPHHSGNRKLAFLLGDSVVFGFASTDTTTISGYLNQIQDQYLFVNAGVPSWNTSQMLARLERELLLYRPQLVVAWGGFNDASIAYTYALRGNDSAIGTPEPFDWSQVGSQRSAWDKIRTALRIGSELGRAVGSNADSDTLATAVAAHFLNNMQRMRELTEQSGARFLSILQPALHFHLHAEIAPNADEPRLRYTTSFRDYLIEQKDPEMPFLDLSAVFDGYYDVIPVFTPGSGPDITDQVFLDDVHIFEPGNRIVAEEIWGRLRSNISDI